MGVPGKPPAENRRRRNADTFGAEKQVIPDGGQIDELRTIPAGEWCDQVKLWWRVWSTCPQSVLFTVTDWLRLHVLIVTVQSYYDRPTAQKMAEIRQTEGLLGATYVDRMKARIKVEKPEMDTKPNLTVIDDYKKRLAG